MELWIWKVNCRGIHNFWLHRGWVPLILVLFNGQLMHICIPLYIVFIPVSNLRKQPLSGIWLGFYQNKYGGQSHGCPVVRTLLSLLRVWVQSLVGKLRSHPTSCMAQQKNKTKNRKERNLVNHSRLFLEIPTWKWHMSLGLTFYYQGTSNDYLQVH